MWSRWVNGRGGSGGVGLFFGEGEVRGGGDQNPAKSRRNTGGKDRPLGAKSASEVSSKKAADDASNDITAG